MTSSNPGLPTPFLFGMALTFAQLDLLARHYFGNDFVDQTCLGDPAYAFDQIWEDRGVDNSIIEIPAHDGSLRYLYVLHVLSSSDGQPPKPAFKTQLLTKIWCKLGKPDVWKNVDVVCTPWSEELGITGGLTFAVLPNFHSDHS
ncbi:hypothetical protein D9758_016460 [Tetrapyrgos nigripes]|uniref:Uncharacterized protein n=1 Tax=Tetrapyrgos nigripes TaxID=182062 RepID=A0A8H5CDH5_9AGAR|nr:hypothetical protein D9758_016460 [Tetrapyrgos nigripes]